MNEVPFGWLIFEGQDKSWMGMWFFFILQGDVRGNKDDFLLLTNDSAVFIYIEHPSQDKKTNPFTNNNITQKYNYSIFPKFDETKGYLYLWLIWRAKVDEWGMKRITQIKSKLFHITEIKRISEIERGHFCRRQQCGGRRCWGKRNCANAH